MNPDLALLHPYPFEKLRRLFAGVEPTAKPINMGIGEPQHPTPKVILDAIQEHLSLLGKYPPTPGTPELRASIAAWIAQRFGVGMDPDRQIVPISGSREGLFGIAQAVIDRSRKPVVLLPNPFYQIYEGAAIMAGAEPIYVPAPIKPDWSTVPNEVWDRVQLAYVCSPGNPGGAVLTAEDYEPLIQRANRHGFIVVADEPYSELYNGEPPMSALQLGSDRVVVFNSLSKRSSAPGLRSGFAAGPAEVIEKYLLYRTYHGAAPSSLVQAASLAAWRDEEHVLENRLKYRAKYETCQPIVNQHLPCEVPDGGFFLWAEVPQESRWQGSDEAFAKDLFAEHGVTVLPGSYLAREVDGVNPGAGRVRIALVAERDTCREACERIAILAAQG